MNFADLRFRLSLSAALGGREYTSVYSRKIILTSVLPRAVLQAVFYVLIARLLDGAADVPTALLGVTGYSLVAATVGRLPDVIAADKVEGTVYRLHLGVLPRPVVALCRCWPYLAEAIASAVAVLIVGAGLIGQLPTAARMLPWLPLLVLAALSLAGFGLAGGAASIGPRADVLVGNVLAAVLLVACPIVVPERIGWLSAFSQVLPLRHTLAALDAALSGGNPWPQEGLEALVGLGWIAVAAVLMSIQRHRGARTGSDDHE